MLHSRWTLTAATLAAAVCAAVVGTTGTALATPTAAVRVVSDDHDHCDCDDLDRGYPCCWKHGCGCDIDECDHKYKDIKYAGYDCDKCDHDHKGDHD